MGGGVVTMKKTCTVNGCEERFYALGYCTKHYRRFKKHGDPLVSFLDRENKSKVCKIEGCDKPKHAHGLCQMHNRRRIVTGDPLVKSLDPKVDRRVNWIEAHKDYAGDDCLKWPFGVGDNGRGVVYRSGKAISAPRSMCIAAHGEPPTPSHETAHLCGRGHEGCMNPRHLTWKTHAENDSDKDIHGTRVRGEMVNTSRLTEGEIREIRNRSAREVNAALAREFGVSQTTISDIKNRRTWAWLD